MKVWIKSKLCRQVNYDCPRADFYETHAWSTMGLNDTELKENSTRGLVADTSLENDRRKWFFI